jgi:subtilase family serine protease
MLAAALLVLSPLARVQAQASAAVSFPAIPDRVPDRILDRVDETNLATIQGSTHPALRNAQDNGRLSPTETMGDLILVLKRSEAQQAALESFNAEQYNPSSPAYHHWLTPEEFGLTYGVSQNDLDTVTNWLLNHGFAIQEISPSRTAIHFSGSSGQVEQTFHTEMHAIVSNGQAHIANISDIQIPAALTPVVVGVKALHNFFPKPQHRTASMFRQNFSGAAMPTSLQLGGTRTQSAGSLELPAAQPSSHAEYNPGDGLELLVPYDMATIYNYKSLWTASTPITGTGQTVALAGTSNIVLSDVATFRAATGLPAKVPTVIITNSDPGTTALLDDRFENTLDVEWSGAAAPGASIVLVTSSQTSQTTDALYASESYIINHNVAKIMSVSYGECELGMGTAGNQEYLNLWQQAYTQGIAVFVSSGDSAAAVCDDGNYNSATDYAAQYGTTVSGMTSTPYNVSVGGTDFAPTTTGWSGANSTNMSNATGYIPETPWNDTVTNPLVISSFDGQLDVNYNAEQWANWLLKNEGISSGLYDELIPPSGGSGGVSSCTVSSNSNSSSCSGGYAKPAWQTGVTGILSTDKRTVPDVSFFASAGFQGVAYLICDSQPPGFTSPIACSYPANALDMAVGGTSVSSPVMAGVMALINQKAGSTQGNPNAQLYALAAKQTYSKCSAESVANSSACYFNDIDTGTIATPCFGGSVNCTPQISGDVLGILPGYAATTGYDKATGLGSLNVANVVNGWPSTAASGPAAAISPASLNFASTIVGATSATQTVTLTNSGTGALTISGITITGATNASGAAITTPFSQTTTCGATLAVNASCTATVTFKPTIVGAVSATLSFADNALSSPQTAALTGAGATSGPAATPSPSSLTFVSTTAGTSSPLQTVTLTNTGSTALTLTKIAIGGTNASSYAQVNNCGTTVAAGASCTASIIFSPTAIGSASATLTFTDNAANSPQTITLSGTSAGAPVATVSPTSLTFPSTAAGAASAQQTVTLTNTGTAPLTFTSSPTITGTYGSLFHGATSCVGNGTLAIGSSCVINFTFNPTATGTFTATLSFNDNAPGSPQTVALSGTGGGAPAVSLTPASLTFASTSIGTSSAAQTVTLKNTGTGTLTLSTVTATGTNSTSFTATNNCGTSLAASASCTLSVTFKPTAAGALTASLSIADNAANSPQTVALSGTGAGLPAVTLTPTSLAFASTNVSASSAAQTVTLKNTGAGTLTLTSIVTAGANPSSFIQTNSCGSLAAGGSCTISVTFKPTAAGALSATLSFTDNATGSPQTVALTGTAVAPVMAAVLSTSTLSFPVTAAGATSGANYSPAQAIAITNTGNAALAISSITLGGTNHASFSQLNNCPSSLAVSASCTALVRFSPTATGSQSATLVFTDNASSTTQSATLSGTGGTAPTFSLSTTTLSFGSITHGTASAAQSATLTNTSSTTPLNLTSIALTGTGAASFVAVNNCGATLAPGSSCVILAQFAPTATGAQAATLTVTANNPTATATVALSGTGQ